MKREVVVRRKRKDEAGVGVLPHMPKGSNRPKSWVGGVWVRAKVFV